jgi:multiple sugar transport system permease protein
MAFVNSLRDMQYREFVGARNYVEFLFQDPRGLRSITNTFLYALIRIPATIVVGFVVANSLLRIRKARSALVFGFFAPYVTNMVAFSAIFIYLYSNTGLFNTVLLALGLPTLGFTRSATQALPSIALMDAWKHVGFDVVIFLAALQSIPSSLYEAAVIDGAKPWQVTFWIKIPLVQPTILYLLVVLFIWTMQVFEPVLVMTGGGPFNATRTIVYGIYQAGFLQFRLGYASAIAYVLFAIILILTLAQLRIGRTRWQY